MFLTEMTDIAIDKIIKFLNENKMMIVSDIIRGR